MKAFLLRLVTLLFLTLWLASCGDDEAEKKDSQTIELPKNPVQEDQYQINDIDIEDHYQWLAETDSEQVQQWQQSQQQLNQEYFVAFSTDAIKEKLEQQIEKNTQQFIGYHFPQQFHHLIFYIKHNAINDDWQIVKFDTLKQQETILYRYPKQKISLVNNTQLHGSGRYLAIEEKLPNQDYQWRVFDTFNKLFIEQELPSNILPSHFQWLQSEFKAFYSADDQVRYHNFSQPNSAFDFAIFDLNNENELSNWQSSLQFSDDQKYLVVTQTNPLNDNTKIFAQKINNPVTNENWIELTASANAEFNFLANSDSTFYFLTNLAAPKNRIISIDFDAPSRNNWKETVKQSDDVLIKAQKLNNQWLLTYAGELGNQLLVTQLNGSRANRVKLEDNNLTNIHDNNTQTQSSKLLTQQSLVSPSKLAVLNLSSLVLNRFSPSGSETASNLTVNSELLYFRSEDSTRIALSLLSLNNVTKPEEAKTLLVADHKFSSMTHNQYDYLLSQWLQQGHQIAIVHGRGSPFYGDSWHQAGIGKQRHNAVNDLLFAAKWLIDKNHAQEGELAAYGRDYSGSLIAETIISEPELFGAVIIENSALDYVQQIENRFWQAEFDFANDSESLSWLLQQSPYANLTPKNYPAILLIDNDYNSLEYQKAAAKWQNNQLSNKPILLIQNNNSASHSNDSENVDNDLAIENTLSEKVTLEEKALLFLTKQLQ